MPKMKKGKAKKRKKGKALEFIKKNVIWVMAALLVLSIVVIVMLWKDKPGPVGTTTPRTTTPPRPLDNDLLFGWRYRDDYAAHNFVCRTCCCDESREDFIYVSNGDVEFDLRTIPNQTSVLTISVGNLNERCRKNEVYVDGFYAGNLNKDGNATEKTDFKFNVTTNSDKIHVKVEHIAKVEECWWGNDLRRARIDLI